MFTGLIEDVGTMVQRQALGKAGKLRVHGHLPMAEIRAGDSIAVNGACLTVESAGTRDGMLEFHTLSETLRRTSLGSKPIGSPVNLERALQAGARFGGHFVQGHVDTTGRVLGIECTADDYVVRISLAPELRALVIPKGSIAVDGISLTIAQLADEQFSVHIIPHTWARTGLQHAVAGDTVNLEGDMIAKYVLRQTRHLQTSGSVAMDQLADAGFL